LLREKQEKVTCGWPGSTSIILSPGFWGGVSVRWREMGGGRMDEWRKKLTGNITHLMIIEHRFTAFVTRHIRHWVLVLSVVHVGYTACEGEADARVVVVAYWSFFCSVSVGGKGKAEKEQGGNRKERE
jgi:hypothetical protein